MLLPLAQTLPLDVGKMSLRFDHAREFEVLVAHINSSFRSIDLAHFGCFIVDVGGILADHVSEELRVIQLVGWPHVADKERVHVIC